MMATRKQLRLIAKIYSALLTYNAMGTGASSDLLTEAEEAFLQDEMKAQSAKIIGRHGVCFTFGELDQIINYVTSKPTTHE